MSFLKNFVTIIRGGANEVGDAIVDANANRILEQEIRDAKDAINSAKASLRTLKSNEIKLGREIQDHETDIADYEAKAVEAIESGQEQLALEVAERIAELEELRDSKKAEYTDLAKEVLNINSMIEKRSRTIEKNKRELDKIKTVAELQKTTSALSSNLAATNSSDSRVKEAMERAKAKQQNWRDEMEAGAWQEEMESGSDLDRKLESAGIGGGNKANDILERLKNKSASA